MNVAERRRAAPTFPSQFVFCCARANVRSGRMAKCYTYISRDLYNIFAHLICLRVIQIIHVILFCTVWVRARSRVGAFNARRWHYAFHFEHLESARARVSCLMLAHLHLRAEHIGFDSRRTCEFEPGAACACANETKTSTLNQQSSSALATNVKYFGISSRCTAPRFPNN